MASADFSLANPWQRDLPRKGTYPSPYSCCIYKEPFVGQGLCKDVLKAALMNPVKSLRSE